MGFHDALETGSQLDSYRIEAPVARSGMASIYRARDLRTGRQLALKTPHSGAKAQLLLHRAPSSIISERSVPSQ